MYRIVVFSFAFFLSNVCFALDDTPENRLAVAEKLIAETVTAGMVENMTNATWPALENQLKAKNPQINVEALAGLKADLAEQQKELIAEIIVDMPAVYAKYFSVGDLQAILDFQTSEVGKRVLELQPQIMAEFMPTMLQSIQEKTPLIMQRFQENAKQKGFDL